MAALGVFVGVVALPAGSMANAAKQPRTLTVSPADNLTNQVVEVSWAGFKPTKRSGVPTVTVMQCVAHPANIATGCYTAATFPNSDNGNQVNGAITAKDGTGHASIEVRPRFDLPQLGCTDSNPCSIVAFEDDGTPWPASGLPLTAASAQVGFEKTAKDCPPVSTFDFQSEGEASATATVSRWAANVCTATPRDIVSYTESSSNRARNDVIRGLVDVGFTSLPATTAELATAPPNTKFVYAPIDATAAVVAYQMQDGNTLEQINDLAITPRLFARLITGSDVPQWDGDGDFTQLNPTAHAYPFKHAAFPLLRGDDNADTWLVTNWLGADPRTKAFLAGNDPGNPKITVDSYWKNYKYPVTAFQNLDHVLFDGGYQTLLNSADVAHHLYYSAPAVASTPDTGYEYVGVLDLPTALRYRLPMFKLT
ncbi:MAG: superfamily domain, partial [Actinomycetia bacterium]|nr:superfamily domain [Actinomycetes bacterium]